MLIAASSRQSGLTGANVLILAQTLHLVTHAIAGVL